MASLQLNSAQQQAVAHGEGACLVIAGAGSGKTRVLTERIARLVGEGVPPWRILGFTFTNKAAGEMRSRLQSTLGPAAEKLWLGTFHSTGVRILRREHEAAGIPRDFTIYDADDQLALVKKCIKNLSLPEGSITPQAARGVIERLKRELQTSKSVEELADGYRDNQVARIFAAYNEGLRAARALDFTDLIAMPVRLFGEDAAVRDRWAARFDYVLVDEFQDTNALQMQFIDHLASACGNLFVVGDDDQSIYGWRGSDVRHVLDFDKRFPGSTLIRLEQNYRSTQPILEAANAVIRHNEHRKGKELWTASETGEKVLVLAMSDDDAEAEEVARRIRAQSGSQPDWTRFAVLYRTHAQSRSLEDALRRHRLPYQIIGGTRFYDRKEIRDLLAYLKVAANPADTMSLLRIINVPPRGIGKTTENRFTDLAVRERMQPGLLMTAFSELLEPLPERGRARLIEFGRLILSLSPDPATDPAPTVLESLLERVPYLDYLTDSDPLQGEVRRENVAELVSAAQSFYESRLSEEAGAEEDADERLGQPGSLLDFLTEIALVADVDQMDDEAGSVLLMTLHNAKGLEFDTVFLPGVEEQLLPHSMSADSDEEIEEERRLFYVGITRAQRRLIITQAMNRRRFGDTLPALPSRFLDELPEEWIIRQGEDLATSGAGFGRGFSGRLRSSYRAPLRKSPTVRSEFDDQFGGAGSGNDFDQDISQDGAQLTKGLRVRHATLGVGTVHKLEGSGEDLKVIVVFDGKGARKLLARVAGLQPL